MRETYERRRIEDICRERQRQLARDPEWRKKLAETDAEVINVLREFSKAKRHSYREEEV